MVESEHNSKERAGKTLMNLNGKENRLFHLVHATQTVRKTCQPHEMTIGGVQVPLGWLGCASDEKLIARHFAQVKMTWKFGAVWCLHIILIDLVMHFYDEYS